MLESGLDLNCDRVRVASVRSRVREKDLGLTDGRREDVVDVGRVGRVVSSLNVRVRAISGDCSGLVRLDSRDEFLRGIFAEQGLCAATEVSLARSCALEQVGSQ